MTTDQVFYFFEINGGIIKNVMKYIKGFASLGVLLVIAGIVAVGGVAYFIEKDSVQENQVLEINDYPLAEEESTASINGTQQETTIPVESSTKIQASASVTPCSPFITVLSPNGGEVFQSGQQVTVEWDTCNANTNDQVMIILTSTQTSFNAELATVSNTGSATVTLPATLGGAQIPVVSGQYYKIRLEMGGRAMGQAVPLSDDSDALFTIQTNQKNGCNPTDPPSITVTNPKAGMKYTVGQNVKIAWTSCNVQDIWLSFGSGGKNFGNITYPNPVPASQGSYQWVASNPAQAYTGSSTNSYFISFEGSPSNVLVNSGSFTVQP